MVLLNQLSERPFTFEYVLPKGANTNVLMRLGQNIRKVLTAIQHSNKPNHSGVELYTKGRCYLTKMVYEGRRIAIATAYDKDTAALRKTNCKAP